MFRFVRNPDPRKKPPYGSRIDPTHPLAQRQVGCWLLNEGGGDKVYDLINSNQGNLIGNTTWDADKLLFDGAGDRVDLSINASPPSLPVSVIVGASIADNTVFQRICDLEGSSAYYGIWVNINSSGQLAINFGDGGSGGTEDRRTKVSSDTVSIGVLHHLAGVIRGATDMDLYVDGKDAGGTYSGSGGAYNPGSTAGYIGAFYDGTFYYLEGSIEYLHVYNRDLTPDEITQLYAEPYCFIQNPRYWYMVDFGAGAGGTTISATAADGISMSDQAGRIATLRAACQDGLSLGDGDSALGTFLAQAQDGISLGDDLTVTGTLQGRAVDGITLSDAVSVIATLLAHAADGVTLADAAGTGTTISATAQDGIHMGDGSQVRADLVVHAADGVSFADTVAAVMTLLAQAIDGITLGDSATGVNTTTGISGTVSVTFTASGATISFSGAAASVTFTIKKPIITFQ